MNTTCCNVGLNHTDALSFQGSCTPNTKIWQDRSGWCWVDLQSQGTQTSLRGKSTSGPNGTIDGCGQPNVLRGNLPSVDAPLTTPCVAQLSHVYTSNPQRSPGALGNSVAPHDALHRLSADTTNLTYVLSWYVALRANRPTNIHRGAGVTYFRTA